MSLPSVLIKKSTGEIVKHANYPREDMGEIIGLDPDYEWLIKTTPFIEPSYDSRLFILNRNEEVTSEPHAEYSHLNQYKITFELEKRPNEDIALQIENAEVEANSAIVPYTQKDKLILLGLGVIFRNIDGQTLNAKETAIKDRVLNVAMKLWKNDAEVRAKVQQLADGEEPIIDDGWERTE